MIPRVAHVIRATDGDWCFYPQASIVLLTKYYLTLFSPFQAINLLSIILILSNAILTSYAL